MSDCKKSSWASFVRNAGYLVQGYQRSLSRKIFRTVAVVTMVLIFTFWYKKYFFIYGAKEDLRMEKICLEFINKSVDKCLEHRSRYEQNKAFAAIKTHLPLMPVKITRANAVFLYTYKNPHIVIKRCIAPDSPGLSEDEILMMLDNKHVVKSFKSFREKFVNRKGEEETIIWLFMEHMDRKVSQEIIRGDENRIREVTEGVLRGLKYLHELGIAHLDLKISNVMGKETKDGVIYKIIDLGFARRFKPEDRNAEIQIPSKSFGTYPYKPPEISQLNVHGIKGDIWSLGAIVWFLSLKQTPFYFDDGKKDVEKWKMFIRGKLPLFFRQSSSFALKDFVRKCMSFDRFSRPSAVELLEHPFVLGQAMAVQDEDDVNLSDDFLSSSGYSSME